MSREAVRTNDEDADIDDSNDSSYRPLQSGRLPSVAHNHGYSVDDDLRQ